LGKYWANIRGVLVSTYGITYGTSYALVGEMAGVGLHLRHGFVGVAYRYIAVRRLRRARRRSAQGAALCPSTVQDLIPRAGSSSPSALLSRRVRLSCKHEVCRLAPPPTTASPFQTLVEAASAHANCTPRRPPPCLHMPDRRRRG